MSCANPVTNYIRIVHFLTSGAQQDTVDVGKGMGSVWLALIVLTVLISYKGRMLSKEIINRMAI